MSKEIPIIDARIWWREIASIQRHIDKIVVHNIRHVTVGGRGSLLIIVVVLVVLFILALRRLVAVRAIHAVFVVRTFFIIVSTKLRS